MPARPGPAAVRRPVCGCAAGTAPWPRRMDRQAAGRPAGASKSEETAVSRAGLLSFRTTGPADRSRQAETSSDDLQYIVGVAVRLPLLSVPVVSLHFNVGIRARMRVRVRQARSTAPK